MSQSTSVIDVPYTPHDKQKEVHSNVNRFKVLNWGRRTGKSTLAVYECLKKGLQLKGRYWIISPTYKQSKNIYWRSLINQLPQELIKKRNETELIVELINGTLIELKGADQPDSLRGAGIQGVVLDEYAFMKPDVWEEIVRPMLLDSKGWAIFISTPNGFNHFYDISELAQQTKNWSYYHATTYDNPYIDKEELDNEKDHTDADTFAQEYLGEFKKVKGLVYPTFDRNTHVVRPEEVPTDGTRYVGVDFGYTNPTAALYAVVDYDNNWYIYDEVYQSRLTSQQAVDTIKRRMNDDYFTGIVGDSAAAQEIANYAEYGLDVQPFKKTGDSIRTGIRLIQDRLKVQDNNRPKLFVSNNCTNLIWEFETYRYDERKENKNEPEEPIKENDHALDALRYMFLEFSEPQTYVPPKRREMRYDEITGRVLT
jgi:PBSX family phage terminase large subunit